MRFLPEEDLVWAETDRNRCVLHYCGGVIELCISLKELQARLPEVFYRPHCSFLVNPRRVSSLKKDGLILTDGTRIPVPAKKFTRVRADLEARSDVQL